MLAIAKQYGEPVRLAKGAFLYRRGVPDGNLYTVREGLLKAFYTTSEGKEFVKTFISEGRYIASISAMLGNAEHSFDVVALEDTHLLRVPGEILWRLRDKSLEGARAINDALLQLVCKKEKREYEFLCLSAEARYQAFLKEYAHLQGRISQYEIARYLGITPVALSRIKSRQNAPRSPSSHP